MYKLFDEFLNYLRLRKDLKKLRTLKKISEVLGCDGEYLACPEKVSFDICARKSQKSRQRIKKKLFYF